MPYIQYSIVGPMLLLDASRITGLVFLGMFSLVFKRCPPFFYSFEDLGLLDLPPKNDMSPSPPKSSKANALLILSKRSSADGPFSTADGTEGLEVLITASCLGPWDQILPTPARPLSRAPVRSPPFGALAEVSVEECGMFDVDELKKFNALEFSNLDGDGGD